MKRVGLLLTLTGIAAGWYVTPARALTSTFSQKILPLNCVFEEVNDGTGTLRYLTPAECGAFISPPDGGAASTVLPQPVTQSAAGQPAQTYLSLGKITGSVPTEGSFSTDVVPLPGLTQADAGGIERHTAGPQAGRVVIVAIGAALGLIALPWAVYVVAPRAGKRIRR